MEGLYLYLEKWISGQQWGMYQDAKKNNRINIFFKLILKSSSILLKNKIINIQNIEYICKYLPQSFTIKKRDKKGKNVIDKKNIVSLKLILNLFVMHNNIGHVVNKKNIK